MTPRVQVVGLGAGGHAKVVIDILSLSGEYEIVGLLDPAPALEGRSVLGVPVIGDDRRLAELTATGLRHFFIGVGGIGDTSLRRRLYEMAICHGLSAVRAIHSRAAVAPSAVVEAGATIAAHAVVNPDARVGVNVIVNTAAVVEHDCVIGDHAHVATGARLAGGVRVEPGAHVGAGATVREGISVGARAIVGAGAVVVADVPPATVVIGVPARILRPVDLDVKTGGTSR